MSFFFKPPNLKNLNRYQQILKILASYGFSDLVQRSHLGKYSDFLSSIFGKKSRKSAPKELNTFQRIRLALEELGPTFIKFGQILSTRPDLIPSDLVQELSKLQDEVTPFSSQEAINVIESELELKKISEVFDNFSTTPIAAASIAQVHQAQLKDGFEVVIKVQRPDINQQIKTDLEMLYHLANIAKKTVGQLFFYDPLELVSEFAYSITQELDFGFELSHILEFSHNFENDPVVYVPKVFTDFCTPRLLVMEYVKGVKVSNLEALQASGLNPKIVARRGLEAVLKQIFEHGFFHADPHPGNILVLPDNVLCFLDFGIFGRLDRDLMRSLGAVFLGVLDLDVDRIIEAFLDLDIIDEQADRFRLKRDILNFLHKYYHTSLKQLKFTNVFEEILTVVRKFKARLPRELMLLGKTLIEAEGLARLLDPDFDTLEVSKPYAKSVLTFRKQTSEIKKDLKESIYSLNQLLLNLPRDAEAFLRKLKRRNMVFELEHKGIDRLITGLDKVSNRLSLALIVAALIIGSSIAIQTQQGFDVWGFSVLGILGFSIAALLGIILAFAILRGRF